MSADSVIERLEELRRQRWYRARAAVGLSDVDDERFALRGLPSPADSLAGRLVILPSDPERNVIEFDGTFWEWFPNPVPDPVTDGTGDFGDRSRSM